MRAPKSLRQHALSHSRIEMSKKKARQRRMPVNTTARRQSPSRRKFVIIIGVVLLLSLASGLLAQWRTAPHVGTKLTAMLLPPLGLAPGSPSKEYIYAGGKLVATEEPGNVTLLAPSNLAATTASAAQINLTWTASPSAVHHYQVERKQSLAGSYTALQPEPTTNSFNDTGVSAGTAYLYRVRAVDASGNVSPYSNLDPATAVTFADDPLTTGTTVIKAQHLTELRQAINAVRALAGLQAASWTDASPQGVIIKAVHVQEMRTNIDEALGALGVSVQPYTDSTLTGVGVKRVHVEELRQRVK
jgi:chitodextrinase